MIADNAPCCEISPESLTTIVSDEEPSSTSRMPVFETAFPTTPMKIAPNIAMNTHTVATLLERTSFFSSSIAINLKMI